MDDFKQGPEWPQASLAVEPVEQEETEVSEKIGNQHDRRDMVRMGKKQELRRNFQFFSIWGYAVIVGSTWEFTLINSVLSLPDGGTAGMVWMFLVACCGMFFATLSMAEMASIAPTAGGQYHWCSEFAPKKYQKFLSYFVGFFCVLGWQTSAAATVFVAAQQIEAIMVLANPNYVPTAWQTALFSWAVLLFSIFANTVLFRKLPLLEGMVLVLHVFAFLAIVITLWITAPRSESPLTTFETNGWSSTGVACLIGLNAAVGDIIGADSSVHLSEELKNAAWILPRSMVATAIMNYILGFITIITLAYCLGNFEDAVNSPFGVPYVEVVLNATQSTGGTIAITSVMLTLLLACSVNNVTTSSRQLWSFARDGGPPFSRWIAHIRPGWDIPMNAMLVTFAITIVLTCIVIGSTTAYGIFLTLTLSGLLSSYMICIFCILYKRLSGEVFPASRFNLGKLGNPINIIALCFLIVAWFFQFWPSTPNPTPAEMNWSAVIYGSCFVFFTLYYLVRARHRYTGPVVHVRNDF